MPSLEHIGIAVENPEAVTGSLEALLGELPYKAETVAEQGVRTHFVNATTAKLELLEATDDDSPVARFLEKQGEGLHHVAFEVPNVSKTMARLREAGFTLLSEEPQAGADDKQICFVHPKETHGVLVEFCETAPATWTPRRVEVDGRTLAVYERGRQHRPSVLCLHGAAGTTRHDLAPLLRRLEPHFHVVGVDLSGHGASSLPSDGTLTLERFTADAHAAIETVAVSTCHVFGFSLGASVALRLAQRTPERIDRLALLSPHLDWTEELAGKMQARLDLGTLQPERPERGERLRARHEAVEPLLTALQSFVATLPQAAEGALDSLSGLTKPALVTALDEDPLFPLDGARTLSQTLPNGRFSVLPGSRHALPSAPLDVLTPLLRRHFGATESG